MPAPMRKWGLGCLLAVVVIGTSPAAGEEARLNVYNWSDYIAPDTVPKFEAETGIKVTYDVYDGNEVLEAKLLSGRTRTSKLPSVSSTPASARP